MLRHFERNTVYILFRQNTRPLGHQERFHGRHCFRNTGIRNVPRAQCHGEGPGLKHDGVGRSSSASFPFYLFESVLW